MFLQKEILNPYQEQPLDFAFSIHSEIGIKTRGTRVNKISSSKL
jgi:(p)ppGpp synthase/HD superfamily hydrolase